MKRLKPRARGRSFTIQKPTYHITIVDEYIDTDSITWSQNKKKRIQLCRIMILIVMGEHGTKNKSNWFHTWYNPRSSFPLVRTTKKLF
ncbi:putative ribosomal protein L22/L17 superfamily [Helianthus anomalus]